MIQANPNQPPWSLVSIIRLAVAKSGYVLWTSAHVHSSLTKSLPQSLMDFLPDSNCDERRKSNLRVTMVWKGTLLNSLHFNYNSLQ